MTVRTASRDDLLRRGLSDSQVSAALSAYWDAASRIPPAPAPRQTHLSFSSGTSTPADEEDESKVSISREGVSDEAKAALVLSTSLGGSAKVVRISYDEDDQL